MIAVLVFLALFWFGGPITWERHAGYFGPAFSPDGRSIYALTRETSGIAWGMGWEHFTPPASAYAFSDAVALVRIDVATGAVTTLERWSSTPITRRVVQNYRNRIFNWLAVTIRPQLDGSVQYAAEISIARIPASENHVLAGVWAPASSQRGDWQPGGRHLGGSEPVLAGQTEVFAMQGPESFPCGIVLLDHAAMTPRTVTWAEACRLRYPEGPPVPKLMEVSRKADLDRIAEIGRVRDERVATYRAEGRSEGEALLQSSRDLQDLGYLARPPQLVAHALSGDDAGAAALPVFDIAEPEMASGIFQDLERAFARPGVEVEKSMGKYIVHRDYTNSARLNAFLDGGGHEFLVRYRGASYRVELRPPTPPKR